MFLSLMCCDLSKTICNMTGFHSQYLLKIVIFCCCIDFGWGIIGTSPSTCHLVYKFSGTLICEIFSATSVQYLYRTSEKLH